MDIDHQRTITINNYGSSFRIEKIDTRETKDVVKRQNYRPPQPAPQCAQSRDRSHTSPLSILHKNSHNFVNR